MRDGGGWVDGAEAVEAHLRRAALGLLPVERRAPILSAHDVPAVGEPQRRRGIAAVGDESRPLGICDAPARELERADQGLVTRAFVIVGEALAVMSHSEDAPIERKPSERRRLARRDTGRGLAVSGLERL